MLRLQRVTNGVFEDECAFINVDTKEIIKKGDYYHDKINEYIDGILCGLEYANIEYEKLGSIIVTPNMALFQLCDFYDNGNFDYNGYDETDCENDLNESVQVKDIKEDILHPYQINHFFKIVDDCNTNVYCNIIEALEKVRNCEGDLFYKNNVIIYSCQGLGIDDNNNLLKQFGVYYDENNKLQIIQ